MQNNVSWSKSECEPYADSLIQPPNRNTRLGEYAGFGVRPTNEERPSSVSVVPGLGNGTNGWGADIWGSSFKAQNREASKTRGEIVVLAPDELVLKSFLYRTRFVSRTVQRHCRRHHWICCSVTVRRCRHLGSNPFAVGHAGLQHCANSHSRRVSRAAYKRSTPVTSLAGPFSGDFSILRPLAGRVCSWKQASTWVFRCSS